MLPHFGRVSIYFISLINQLQFNPKIICLIGNSILVILVAAAALLVQGCGESGPSGPIPSPEKANSIIGTKPGPMPGTPGYKGTEKATDKSAGKAK